MRQIGREEDLEKINRTALKIAREVADDTNTLMAGGICNSNIYVAGDKENEGKIRAMFEEQVRNLWRMCVRSVIEAHLKAMTPVPNGKLGKTAPQLLTFPQWSFPQWPLQLGH